MSKILMRISKDFIAIGYYVWSNHIKMNADLMKILIMFTCATLFGCTSNKSKEQDKLEYLQRQSIKTESKSKNTDVRIRHRNISDSICYQNYTLKVIDYPAENIPEKIMDKFYYRHLVRYQELIIKIDNVKSSAIILPIPTSEVKLKNGVTTKIWNHRIVELGLLKGTKGFLFYVSGFEGCNACDEFYSLISQKGEIKYLIFKGRSPVEGENIGNWETALDEIDCPREDFNEDKFEKVFVVDGLKEFKGI